MKEGRPGKGLEREKGFGTRDAKSWEIVPGSVSATVEVRTPSGNEFYWPLHYDLAKPSLLAKHRSLADILSGLAEYMFS